MTKGRKPFLFPSGKTCKELADEYGKSEYYVAWMHKKGYSEDEIIKVCSYKSLSKICREKGVSYNMVSKRINNGMSLDEALSKPFTPYGKRNIELTKYKYKGQPLKELFPYNTYQRIVRAFRAGKGTLEQLTEKYL